MSESKYKPVIVLPKQGMSKADIKELRKAGFCVVECADPSKVRFMDPPIEGCTGQERAALALCREVLSMDKNQSIYAGTISHKLAQMMMANTTPKQVPQVSRASS